MRNKKSRATQIETKPSHHQDLTIETILKRLKPVFELFTSIATIVMVIGLFMQQYQHKENIEMYRKDLLSRDSVYLISKSIEVINSTINSDFNSIVYTFLTRDSSMLKDHAENGFMDDLQQRNFNIIINTYAYIGNLANHKLVDINIARKICGSNVFYLKNDTAFKIFQNRFKSKTWDNKPIRADIDNFLSLQPK